MASRATAYLAASVGTLALGPLYAAHGFATFAWVAASIVALAATVSVVTRRGTARA